MDTPPNAVGKRPAAFERRRVAEQALIIEIENAASAIATALDVFGRPVFRTDGIWRVLAAVERSHYCLAIADLARALHVRRQVAHQLAHLAERAEVIELAPNHQDKRILQLFLTPKGRGELAAARSQQSTWLAMLFNGLGDHELANTTRIVRALRQRLERNAREWAARTP